MMIRAREMTSNRIAYIYTVLQLDNNCRIYAEDMLFTTDLKRHRRNRMNALSYIEWLADFTDVFRREAVIVPVEATVPEIFGSAKRIDLSVINS